MKKIILLLLCILTLTLDLNVSAAGGGVYVGDDSPETLFTGSVSSHYLFLSSNGIVSSWGENSYGQCGTEPCGEITKVNYIDFDSKVVKVVAGNGFSLALDENNVVWGWGDNRYFQLGISRPTGANSFPTYFVKPEKIEENIVDIAAGENFSVLLTTDGEVLLSGNGQSRVLKKISPDNTSFNFIVASYDNIIAIDENNMIYHWKADARISDVIEIPEVDEVHSVAVGKKHLVFVCCKNDYIEIYTYGDNSKYQLGTGDKEFVEMPVKVLTLPIDENKYVNVHAGEYCTVVESYNNMSFHDDITEYIWGTDVFFEEDSDETFITEPYQMSVKYQLIAVNGSRYVAFDYVTNSIVVCEKTEQKKIIPLIEPVDEVNPIYMYQYNDLEYHTYNVNFIKLNEGTFPNENSGEKYLLWEYVNENQFRVKVKDFITGIGQSRFSPAISTIKISKESTGENRDVGTYGPSVWNFNIGNDVFKTEPLEINHKSENGVAFTVSLFEVKRMEEKPVVIPPDVNIFYENPGEITENTKLGLYLYGLPDGVTALISDISENRFKVTLSGTSNDDLDYDTNVKLCYIRTEGTQIDGNVVGDLDLNKIRVVAVEEVISGFTIKTLENTPEILTISGTLTKGRENGKIINASISGGVFNDTLSPDMWYVSGVDGVSVQSVKKIDQNNVELILAGNSNDKYTDGEMKITCDSSQYSDSREYDDAIGIYVFNDLSTSNTIEVKKQSKGSYASSDSYIAIPTSSVKSGKVNKGTLVELLSSVSGAKIYYTTDGSLPNDKSMLYQEPVRITEDVTIKFIAISGAKKSSVQTVTYTVADISLKNNASEIKYIIFDNHEVEADKEMSRYEILSALHRLFDIEDMNITSGFSDVDIDNVDVVNLFVGAGIIEGYPDNTFRGESGITRAEFVKMLSIILNVEKSESTYFSDISGHWCEEYINSFTKLDLVNGYPDGTFKPDDIITKAEVIAVLNRIAGKDTELIEKMFFTGIDESHWAYKDICAAVLQ